MTQSEAKTGFMPSCSRLEEEPPFFTTTGTEEVKEGLFASEACT